MSTPTVTRIGRPWLLKFCAFLLMLVGFGIWGLYDAVHLYPQRGLRHARFVQWEMMQEAERRGRLDSRLGTEDPRAELARLRDLAREGRDDALDKARLAWLQALSNAGHLSPDKTTITDARATFEALRTEWTAGAEARNAPKPLASYDIPVQWLFCAIGLGGGALLLVHILRVARRRYRWDPSTKTLTLPGGERLSPADLQDIDKRKWDKFLVFLLVKPGHASLGGREIKLDLYHHDPLESWVLEMEKAAFPERAQEASAQPAQAPPGAPDRPDSGGSGGAPAA
ncbi:hypothetical protein J4558_21240 [Leptolyngbya sp. 15MV]|nr:hypothetical protein J4558_21240 [Leptolyngbya sp. 15MV]